METGTQILIERMKTHPEEFIEGRISKWADVMHLANDCLPDEDKVALKQAYTQAKVDRFNEEVLKTLAGEVEVEESVRLKVKERYATGFTDPRGVFGQAPVKREGQTVTLSNGTSLVDLVPSAFGAVPMSGGSYE